MAFFTELTILWMAPKKDPAGVNCQCCKRTVVRGSVSENLVPQKQQGHHQMAVFSVVCFRVFVITIRLDGVTCYAASRLSKEQSIAYILPEVPQ